MHLVENFRREGELRDNILLGREAIEGVIVCRKVDAVKGLNVGEIVLYM